MTRPDQTGAEELRVIVNMLNNCNETAIDPYTAEQLLALCRAWRASAWDLPIDSWTPRQIREALRGVPPSWVVRNSNGRSGVLCPLYNVPGSKPTKRAAR